MKERRATSNAFLTFFCPNLRVGLAWLPAPSHWPHCRLWLQGNNYNGDDAGLGKMTHCRGKRDES